MKAIKVVVSNANKIEASLRIVNGTASLHTYVYYADIFNAIESAEHDMDKIL